MDHSLLSCIVVITYSILFSDIRMRSKLKKEQQCQNNNYLKYFLKILCVVSIPFTYNVQSNMEIARWNRFVK